MRFRRFFTTLCPLLTVLCASCDFDLRSQRIPAHVADLAVREFELRAAVDFNGYVSSLKGFFGAAGGCHSYVAVGTINGSPLPFVGGCLLSFDLSYSDLLSIPGLTQAEVLTIEVHDSTGSVVIECDNPVRAPSVEWVSPSSGAQVGANQNVQLRLFPPAPQSSLKTRWASGAWTFDDYPNTAVEPVDLQAPPDLPASSSFSLSAIPSPNSSAGWVYHVQTCSGLASCLVQREQSYGMRTHETAVVMGTSGP